jgi:hypothetical protein
LVCSAGGDADWVGNDVEIGDEDANVDSGVGRSDGTTTCPGVQPTEITRVSRTANGWHLANTITGS